MRATSPRRAEEANARAERSRRSTRAYLPIAMAALQAGKPDEARSRRTTRWPRSAREARRSPAWAAPMSRCTWDATAMRGTELQAGAASDEAGKLVTPRALKVVALAEAARATQVQPDAVTLANQALLLSSADAVVVPAARILVVSGRTEAAPDHRGHAREAGPETQPRHGVGHSRRDRAGGRRSRSRPSTCSRRRAARRPLAGSLHARPRLRRAGPLRRGDRGTRSVPEPDRRSYATCSSTTGRRSATRCR